MDYLAIEYDYYTMTYTINCPRCDHELRISKELISNSCKLVCDKCFKFVKYTQQDFAYHNGRNSILSIQIPEV